MKSFEKPLQKTRKCPHCRRELTAKNTTCPWCKVATMTLEEHDKWTKTKREKAVGLGIRNATRERAKTSSLFRVIHDSVQGCVDKGFHPLEVEANQRFMGDEPEGCQECHGEQEFCDGCNPCPGKETFEEWNAGVERLANGNIKIGGIEYAPIDRPYVIETDFATPLVIDYPTNADGGVVKRVTTINDPTMTEKARRIASKAKNQDWKLKHLGGIPK